MVVEAGGNWGRSYMGIPSSSSSSSSSSRPRSVGSADAQQGWIDQSRGIVRSGPQQNSWVTPLTRPDGSTTSRWVTTNPNTPELSFDQVLPRNDWGQTFTTSGGGGRGFGGGGGGGGGSPFTQGAFDALIGMLGGTRPENMEFQRFQMDPYKAPKFYAFNRQPFQQARKGLRTAFRDDRRQGNQAFRDAQGELAQYNNPFEGGIATTDPGTSAAMQRMMAAQGGAGEEAAAQTAAEGVQADAAMGNTAALLAGVDAQNSAAQARALQGDRRRFNEGLSAERRGLSSGIDVALANALSDYQKDRFGYRASTSRQRYDDRMNQAMMNWMQRNQTNQANTQASNAWRQAMTSPIMQMVMANPGLNFDALGGFF